ncbi:MAG TPA: DUF2269 family protein [Actinomycetota bacterium]
MIATLYSWLLFLHILMAITWVGGAIALQVLGTRIDRTGDPQRVYDTAVDFEFVGTRVFMPASLILLGLGIWMVIIGPWSFHQFWVAIALGMFAYSFVSGAFYIGPTLGKVKRAWEQEGAASREVPVLVRRIFLASRIELALLILIVADMVLKPFL